MGFIDEIKAKAKTCKKTIVLPETEDIRTYEAAEAVLKEGTANLILVEAKKRSQRTREILTSAALRSWIRLLLRRQKDILPSWWNCARRKA